MHVVQTLVAVDCRARAGLTLQVGDRRSIGEQLHDEIALSLAALDVVGADMAENARRRRHPPVDGDDRHLGVDRLLQRRRHRVDVDRADHDAFDALGQRRLDVGGLFGRRVLAIALDRCEALLRRFGVERLHHVDEERKVHSRNGDQDQRLVFGEGRRGERHREQARGHNSASDAHLIFLPRPAQPDMSVGAGEPCPNSAASTRARAVYADFDRHRGRFAAADAERGDAALEAARLAARRAA